MVLICLQFTVYSLRFTDDYMHDCTKKVDTTSDPKATTNLRTLPTLILFNFIILFFIKN